MSNNTTIRPHLRYPVGTKVMARLGRIEFFPGTIIKHWVQREDLPVPAPYLIQLDQDLGRNNDNGEQPTVIAPKDCDTWVKLPPPPGHIYFDQGFIKDNFSKECEPVQGVPFLYTGKAPELGLRVEIAFSGPRYYCRVSGILTEIDSEPPTFDQWVLTSSLAPKICCSPAPTGPDPYAFMSADIVLDHTTPCPVPSCTWCEVFGGRDKMTLGELKAGTERLFGATHGHKAVAFGYLNFDYFHEQHLPLQRGRIYKVNLRLDDRKINVWTAESLEDVSHWAVADLPQVFQNWDIGRESADVAPFDLPQADRQAWYDRVQAENAADRSGGPSSP